MTRLTALLLDLDGTLLDTAPEMAEALNILHREVGIEPLPFNQVRPTVSHGSTGMLNLAFSGVAPTEFERLRARFLDAYRAILGSNTQLFAGFDAMQLRLQQGAGSEVPYQLWLMLPYLLSILALVLVARRAAYPQALMKPYRKGER